MKLSVLHNIQKVFDKYFIYLYMFDTEDSENAMSRHWPIYVGLYNMWLELDMDHPSKAKDTQGRKNLVA